jgi:hypothetical protein
LRCVATTLHELTVTQGGPGTGTVTSTLAGINCGTDCAESYTTGTVVTLTATPAFNARFAGWSGAGTGSTSTCTVTMSEARNVTATFAGTTRVVVTVANTLESTFANYGTNVIRGAGLFCAQTGDGTQTCEVTVTTGSPITLTAEPSADDDFESWTSGPCAGSISRLCTFTPSGAQVSLTGRFDD